MSIFNRIQNELTGGFYQTTSLSSIPNNTIQRLIVVAAIIKVHYIDDAFWKFEIQKGSFTFRYHYHQECSLCKKDQHKVIKVFVDIGQKLANMENICHLFRPDYEPIAIGIELGYEDPYMRKSIRKLLREEFKDYYLDPVSTHQKYILNPSKYSEHFYDIVFLKEGSCPDCLLNKRVHSLIEEITAEYKKSIGSHSVQV